MRFQNDRGYYIYIVANKDKTVLHCGFTGDLPLRLYQYECDVNNGVDNFVAKNECIYLVYWEKLPDAQSAITREKEIKEFSIKKKMALICQLNPEWRFLNNDFVLTEPFKPIQE